MKEYRIGILVGDGIGPEIIAATKRVWQYALAKEEISYTWVELPMGLAAIKNEHNPLPQKTIDELKGCDGWLMGPHDSASYPHPFNKRRNPSGQVRKQFDLYANIRPAKTIVGLTSVVKEADLVICRENTEGFYSDRNMFGGSGEWRVTEDVVISAGVFSRTAIERIAHEACRLAMKRKKKLTIVHKANVITHGMGMFRNCCMEVAKQYPELIVDEFHIDAMVAHLVRSAHAFDVIVTENMYGDILSDLTGELVGSLGLAPSINCNQQQAMAQAAHGSAPDIAGKNIANPMGMMQSAIMLTLWLAEKYEDDRLYLVANTIEQAIFSVIRSGVKTIDLGGHATTTEFTQAVIQMMEG